MARKLPPEEQLAGIWPLVERQALLYTGGDSSSLPLETVERLFGSILFCLEAEKGAGCAENDPAALLRAGQRTLAREAEEGKRLYRRVAATSPKGSASLDATLAGIQYFFAWYDIRFFAQEVPASIDYPLCLPVDEESRGIRYIRAYLERLHWENRFLGCFESKQREQLLDACRPGWREVPHNLCVPVFAAALGGALAGGEPSLVAGQHRQRTLEGIFAGRDLDAVREILRQGAAQVCNGLRLWDTVLRGYFFAWAPTLAPLIAAADGEGLANLFYAL